MSSKPKTRIQVKLTACVALLAISSWACSKGGGGGGGAAAGSTYGGTWTGIVYVEELGDCGFAGNQFDITMTWQVSGSTVSIHDSMGDDWTGSIQGQQVELSKHFEVDCFGNYTNAGTAHYSGTIVESNETYDLHMESVETWCPPPDNCVFGFRYEIAKEKACGISSPTEGDVVLLGTEVHFQAMPQASGASFVWTVTQGSASPASGSSATFDARVLSEGELRISLEVSVAGTTCTTVRSLQVVRPEVVEVHFDEDRDLRHWEQDDLGYDIEDPVWVKPFGSTTVTEDEPAAYPRSQVGAPSVATAMLGLQASQDLTHAATIEVWGRGQAGSEDFDFDQAIVRDWAQMQASDLKLQSTPLSDVNGAYAPMSIDWYYVVQSLDGSFPPPSEGIFLGQSSHRIYTTYDVPKETIVFDLALDKACVQYASGENVLSVIASKLNTGIDAELCYNPAASIGMPLNAYSAGQCLCENHAALMRLLARSVGVDAELRYFYGGQLTGFPPAETPLKFKLSGQQDALSTFQSPNAQHDRAPDQPHFGYHVQVRIPIGTGTYYDPSYGTTGMASSLHECLAGSQFFEDSGFPAAQSCTSSDPHPLVPLLDCPAPLPAHTQGGN